MGQDNIRKYRKPLNLNIGLLCFLAIMFYIFVCVFTYFTSKHIVGYEVKTGSLSVSNVYEGIALRNETVVKSNHSGYINYYAKEGEKVGCGNVVCSIDETGQLQDIIGSGENASIDMLSEQDKSELKSEIIDFSSSFHSGNFTPVYDFKYSIEGSVVKFANRSLLANLSDLAKDSANGLINLCNSPESGIVVYSTDGFEEQTSGSVNMSWFDKENYDKHQLINNEIVSVGDPIYKLTDSEDWSIIIPVERKRAEELVEEEYVKVKFLKNRYESWGRVEMIDGTDGETFVQLFFTNSMITFATDRFIDIELITDQETGLKVPNSSIVDKDFYLVPIDYITKGGNNNSDGVLKEVFSEDGTMTPVFTPITIYNEENGEYYIDSDSLAIGDRIDKTDSTENYTISKKAGLTGVYNINKGYADFKQIKVLNKNDEYSIIESNTNYGLVAYDYIVLDAESVEVDEFIYD